MAVERWTDEMLDEFASSVSEMRNSVSELQNSVFEMRNSIIELRDGVDGLRITAQALLQVAAQNQQKMDLFEQEIELIRRRQAKNDERFNVLLEEVRYLIRGNETDRN